MRYRELCERMEQMAQAASLEARRHFAYDSLRLLRETAHEPIEQQLTDTERQVLQMLLDAIADRTFAVTGPLFQEICDRTGNDEIRALGLDGSITDLLVGIDYLLTFERTGDPAAIARLASTMVDSVDNAVCGVVEGYSLDDMFAAPAMREEYERQQHLLLSSPSAE